MPLPGDGVLSLQGFSRPGDALQSKPRQAMIVRMSAETLEALDTPHPKMDFEFGENPGIYIGETFFPMRPLKESSPHEIYLRAASAAKPMAPLKLYANVTGKFTVERQLGDKVRDGIRDRTQEVKKQHQERKAILLDTPPAIPTAGKKRKAAASSSQPSKKFAAIEQTRSASSSTTNPSSSTVSKLSPDVRKRMIHCLAVSARQSEDVIKLIGGSESNSSSRNDLIQLLEEVAEHDPPPKRANDKTPKSWRLKSQSWLDVRPYEWPRLTENERTSLARQARLAFKQLRIPESDPAWDNVRYRNSTNTSALPPTATPRTSSGPNNPTPPSKPEPKRPAISREIKEQKKAKLDASRGKGEIMMKDEGAKARKTIGAVNGKDVEHNVGSNAKSSLAAQAAIPGRRLPGSGFKAHKAPSQDSSAGSVDGALLKPAASVDVRSSQRSPLPPSLPPKPTPAPPPDRKPNVAAPVKIIKKVKESTSSVAEESDRELEKDRNRRKEKDRDRQNDRDPLPTAVKRKAPSREDDDGESSVQGSTQKKRRTDEASSMPPPAAREPKARDLSLPRKPMQEPSPAPRPKIKKESSPLPPPSQHLSSTSQEKPSRPKIKKESSPLPSHDRVSSVGSQRSQSQSSAGREKDKSQANKVRRKSPIYTSSEDEGEIPQRDTVPSSTQPRSHEPSQKNSRASYPIASTKHTTLRTQYNSSYSNYMDTFMQMLSQKRNIEAVLNGDSESELDLMDPEELLKLTAEHKRREEELESIRRSHALKNGIAA